MYQPKTGARCGCKRGVQRDNCPACEGTGMVVDFAAIRARGKPCLSADCKGRVLLNQGSDYCAACLMADASR